ncbi:MAG: hypothetical protein IPP90_22525 [Gemmatimonadaceae bacterium]|nr:hypothetical protein [Gemmatimonadaceae bacterium]
MMATFDATTQSGALSGLAASMQYQGVTYLIVGLSTTASAGQHGPLMDASIRSFKALSDPALLNVQPAKVQLVALPEAMTGLVFTQRYPSSIAVEQVYIINGMDATTSLARGAMVKRVVGGLPK